MAIKPIVKIGNPILTKKAKLVDEFNTEWLKSIIGDLYETMTFNNGTGLTAPQINVDLNVMVTGPNTKRTNIPKLAIVNPKYEIINHDLIEGWESCFSIPDMMGYVKRYSVIRYEGFTYDNLPISGIADGWHSVIIQHEIDHLNGITLLNRIDDLHKFGYKEEVNRYLIGNMDE